MTRNRDFLLGPADVWAAVNSDPDTAALKWAVDQLEPAAPAEVGSESETAVMAVTSLARASEPAKWRIVALGALPKCAKIRDGSVRVNKHFCSIANRLHKLLSDALKQHHPRAPCAPPSRGQRRLARLGATPAPAS